MNYLKVIFVFLLCAGCKKDKIQSASASLTIINAVVGTNPLKTNFSNSYLFNSYYKNAQQFSYGTYNATINEFGCYCDIVNLKLYQMPDTLEHSSPLYNLTLNVPASSINTLFLIGLSNAPDTLFTTDNPPYHEDSDSSVGVRFVNLSSGSNPVNVTLSSLSTVKQFSNIAYKGITDFKNFSAIASVSSYTFQFRDAVSNALLASYTMGGINNGTGANTAINNYRFRNFTIALIGQPSGTGAAVQKALLINNY